jgi:DNA-binding SARP family transcriptional activator
VEFGILGPLEVRDGGRVVPIVGTRQRTLLAILLLEANRVVSSDRLLDALWGAEQPRSGATALRVRVSELRKTLDGERRAGSARLLVTEPGGYALRIPLDSLDLHRFERLAAEGERALEHGDSALASLRLREALALWRGPALEGLGDWSFAQLEVARLEELRLAALELRIEADLALGGHAELIGELDALVQRYPLREHLRALLMRVLYRSGRQAEALALYAATRRALVEELGIEPGPALQQLHHAVLAQDPALDPASPTTTRDSRPRERAILAVARDDQRLEPLLELADLLARRPPRELIAARIVEGDDLAHAADALNERREYLIARGAAARTAAFTSTDAATDILRLVAEQPVDLLLIATEGVALGNPFSAELARVLDGSPCDVALVVAECPPTADSGRPVVVPFGGAEHDWAAVELAAWAAAALGSRVRLVGAAANPALRRRDASRALAAAALAVQRAFGVAAEPALVGPAASELLAVAEEAALLVLGLSQRWPKEGVGRVRRTIVAGARSPTVLVKAGLRPGGLAPSDSGTRFTWSLAAVADRGVSSRSVGSSH